MRIAIVGTGISGMTAAYLFKDHDITVYESEDYIGGHSRTIQVDNTFIDTGFIVFNHKNYPNLSKLFQHLGVATAKSDMSFGVSINNGWFEYGTKRLTDIFAQKRNLCRPSFYRMLSDINKFNHDAEHHVKLNPGMTVNELVLSMNLGSWFQKYYLLAMAGAIWSSPTEQIQNFPADTLINFFKNHGLLTINDQPQWHTVKGGSKNYVMALTKSFSDKISINNKVLNITRGPDAITVFTQNCQKNYDHVILACHSDQALELIEQPTQTEHEILNSIKYHPNRVVLHSDASFMPVNKKAWASWVYLNSHNKDISLSYWMNNLQPLGNSKNFFVTLNPTVQPTNIHNEHIFSHPVFDAKAIEAQKRLEEIQGKDRIWFCGAWQKYGFHEDGISSAIKLAELFGIKPTWI